MLTANSTPRSRKLAACDRPGASQRSIAAAQNAPSPTHTAAAWSAAASWAGTAAPAAAPRTGRRRRRGAEWGRDPRPGGVAAHRVTPADPPRRERDEAVEHLHGERERERRAPRSRVEHAEEPGERHAGERGARDHEQERPRPGEQWMHASGLRRGRAVVARDRHARGVHADLFTPPRAGARDHAHAHAPARALARLVL